MRNLLFVLFATLAVDAAVLAQSTSGRSFHRWSRLPATPPAAAAVEATAATSAPAPLPKLRSGRPWPRHHFTRLPRGGSAAASTPVEAAATKSRTRRGFWSDRR